MCFIFGVYHYPIKLLLKRLHQHEKGEQVTLRPRRFNPASQKVILDKIARGSQYMGAVQPVERDKDFVSSNEVT